MITNAVADEPALQGGCGPRLTPATAGPFAMLGIADPCEMAATVCANPVGLCKCIRGTMAVELQAEHRAIGAL